MENSFKIIDFSKIASSIVSSRQVVDELAKEIRKIDQQRIFLDFSNIQFISRSATHELIRLKEQLSHIEKKHLEFMQINSEVKNMLRIIAANRIVPIKPVINNDIKLVNIESIVSTT